MAPDPLSQVERAATLFERGPITAVAAFFAIAFFVVLGLLLRAQRNHAAELAILNAARLAEAKRASELATTYIALAEAKRRGARRIKTNPGTPLTKVGE